MCACNVIKYIIYKVAHFFQVFLASEANNRVLVWSFTDCLSPKLILACPREVTSVGVCPLDASIIVGGCESGQVNFINHAYISKNFLLFQNTLFFTEYTFSCYLDKEKKFSHEKYRVVPFIPT